MNKPATARYDLTRRELHPAARSLPLSMIRPYSTLLPTELYHSADIITLRDDDGQRTVLKDRNGELTVATDSRRFHYLKCWRVYFEKVVSGEKPFEIRKHDRDFRVGDTLCLRETEGPPDGAPTGRGCFVKVTCVLTAGEFPGLATGYCALGIKEAIPVPFNFRDVLRAGLRSYA